MTVQEKDPRQSDEPCGMNITKPPYLENCNNNNEVNNCNNNTTAVEANNYLNNDSDNNNNGGSQNVQNHQQKEITLSEFLAMQKDREKQHQMQQLVIDRNRQQQMQQQHLIEQNHQHQQIEQNLQQQLEQNRQLELNQQKDQDQNRQPDLNFQQQLHKQNQQQYQSVPHLSYQLMSPVTPSPYIAPPHPPVTPSPYIAPPLPPRVGGGRHSDAPVSSPEKGIFFCFTDWIVLYTINIYIVRNLMRASTDLYSGYTW